jgi:hypothetical protein
MQRINVMVSDEAWQYLKDFQETGGYRNRDEAANALLLIIRKLPRRLIRNNNTLMLKKLRNKTILESLEA